MRLILMARQARSNVANRCLDVPTAAPGGNPNHLPANPGQYPVAGEVLAAQFAPGVNVVIAVDFDIQPQSVFLQREVQFVSLDVQLASGLESCVAHGVQQACLGLAVGPDLVDRRSHDVIIVIRRDLAKLGTQRCQRGAQLGVDLRMAQDDERLPGAADGHVDQVLLPFHPGGGPLRDPRRQHRRKNDRVFFAALEPMSSTAAEVSGSQTFITKLLVAARQTLDQRRLRRERRHRADRPAGVAYHGGDLENGDLSFRNVRPTTSSASANLPPDIDPSDASFVGRHPGDIGQDGERSVIEHAIEPAGDVRVTAIVLVEHDRLVGIRCDGASQAGVGITVRPSVSDNVSISAVRV